MVIAEGLEINDESFGYAKVPFSQALVRTGCGLEFERGRCQMQGNNTLGNGANTAQKARFKSIYRGIAAPQ